MESKLTYPNLKAEIDQILSQLPRRSQSTGGWMQANRALSTDEALLLTVTAMDRIGNVLKTTLGECRTVDF